MSKVAKKTRLNVYDLVFLLQMREMTHAEIMAKWKIADRTAQRWRERAVTRGVTIRRREREDREPVFFCPWGEVQKVQPEEVWHA